MNSKKKSHRGTDQLFSLTEGEAVVHRDKSGKVSPLWLGACEAERTLTEGIMENELEFQSVLHINMEGYEEPCDGRLSSTVL